MSAFLTELNVCLVDDCAWRLLSPLVFQSDILSIITVPEGFETDFASVPRIPIIYEAWGNRAHREAIIHDYLYCIDCLIHASYQEANSVFLEAMKERGKPFYVRYPMYWGVQWVGWPFWKRRTVYRSEIQIITQKIKQPSINIL